MIDEQALECGFRGWDEPYVVHHYVTKPWLEPTLPGVYTQLLMRLLRGRDVAIRVPRRDLPLHLQPGVIAGAKRWCRGPLSERARALRDQITGQTEPSGS